MRKFLVLGLLAFAGPAFAGNGSVVGNGGDVVYCANPLAGQKRIELLDYFEARVLNGIELDLGLDPILTRLSRLSPGRAKMYRDQAKTFLSEAVFVKEDLEDIPDSQHIALPVGCKIRQIVIQNPKPADGQPRYAIDRRLWDELDENGKEGLILHELIYREAIGFGHRNSIATRYFNGTISSTVLARMDFWAMRNLLTEAELPSLDFVTKRGHVLQFYPAFLFKGHEDQVGLYPDGTIEHANVSSVTIGEQRVESTSSGFEVHYSPNGNLSKINGGRTTPLSWKVGERTLRFADQVVWDGDEKVESGILAEITRFQTEFSDLHCKGWTDFHPDGSVKTCTLDASSPQTALIQGRAIEIKPGDHKELSQGVLFFPGGRLRFAALKAPTVFDLGGQKIKLYDNVLVRENGTIEDAMLAEESSLKVIGGKKYRLDPYLLSFNEKQEIDFARVVYAQKILSSFDGDEKIDVPEHHCIWLDAVGRLTRVEQRPEHVWGYFYFWRNPYP